MIAAMDERQTEIFLQDNHIGRIGCFLEDRPYVVPVTYVYANGYIYGHTSEGLKVTAMRQHPLVCFEVDDIRDMQNWRSVIVWGSFEQLTGDAADKGFELMVSKLAPHAISRTFAASERDIADYLSRGIRLPPDKGVVYRIVVDRSTGRMETH